MDVEPTTQKTHGLSTMLFVKELELMRCCDESWCREGVREGTHGYQLRLEIAPILLCRFLIIGVELWEARGDR